MPEREPGPARAGALIYAKHVDALVAFYRAVLGMTVVHSTADLAVLASPDAQLVIHTHPRSVAEHITITAPPELRERTAIKLFFTVDSLASSRAQIAQLGGVVLPEIWSGPRFRVCNVADPEGNIFHIRELTP